MNDPQLYEVALAASKAVYSTTSIAEAFLLMFVIFQALNDPHLNRHDPPAVIKNRRRAFFAGAAYLTVTVCFRDYWIVSPIVGVVTAGLNACGTWILSINVISLSGRAPTQNQQGAKSSLLSIVGRVAHRRAARWP